MSNNQPSTHRSSLYTTRTNKISSTISAIEPSIIQQQQSQSMLTNRTSHRKYKLSHSQITKIDKLSRQGLLRWKQCRQSQDQNCNNYNSNSNNNNRSGNKSRQSQKSLTVNKKNNIQEQQNSIKRKTVIEYQQQNDKNRNNSKTKQDIIIKQKQQEDNINQSDHEEIKDNNNKTKRSSSNLSTRNKKMSNQKNRKQQHNNLHEIKQATTSMHSINYQLRKDKIIQIKKQQITLHVEIITFDMAAQYHKSKRNIAIMQKEKKKQVEFSNFSNFQQQQQYQQQQQQREKLRQKQRQQRQKQKQQQRQSKIIQVICFQIHDKKINMHYRSQFTYKTLGKDVKFVFEDIQELFQYVTDGGDMVYENNDSNKKITFNKQTMQLQIKITFNRTQQQKSPNQQHSQPKQRQKTIKIPLLPFAIIEIIQHHPHQLQHQKEKKQLLLEISQLKRDLQASRNLIHALRDENDKLKIKAKKERIQAEKQKAQKQLLIESYQKLSKASQVPNKQYYFQFIPDNKAKNYTNFTFKNNILKKVKNDLKWDQISSQAPLPKAGRHYFSFLIKDFLPDFMFGIVTMKGKDTSNAFLGLETICLYASKNNCYIYQRGKHYKISVNVKRNDTIFVIIDRQKNVIQWLKRKGQGNINDKQRSPQAREEYKIQQPHMDHKTSLAQITPHPRHTQDDMPTQNPHHHHHPRQRKTSQVISSTQFLTNQLSAISILPLTTAVDFAAQQIDYIHSTTIPEQMLVKQMYGYLEVYNINQPIKLNERK